MPDTFSPAPRAPAMPPFSTPEALKAAHADLLRRRRFNDDAPESQKEQFLEEVRTFIERGHATGVLLESVDERSNAQTLLNYWTNVLCHSGQSVPDAILAEFDDSQAPDLTDGQCPYRSLETDVQKDSGLFHGWKRLIQDCVEKLGQNCLVAVVGATGSGRSSLVRGGLLPVLQEGKLPGSAHWRYPGILTPGDAPLSNLARLLQPAGSDAPAWITEQVEEFRKDDGHLARLLAGAGDAPTVLVVDPFEQVFFSSNTQDRQAFLDNLLAAARGPGPRHMVVLVVRSDYLNHAAQMDGLQLVLQQSQVFLAFTTRELRQAIEEPAKAIGLRFDEGIVDRMLREIQGDPSALTLLQFTLLNLWDHRQRNRITEEVYNRLGAGRLAVERAAESLYKKMKNDEQATVKRILLQLVRPGVGQEVNTNGVRREQLYVPGKPRALVDQVFDQLVRARLVRVTAAERPDDALVAVWHEALVVYWGRLVEWLNDTRDAKRRRLRLTAAAEQWRDNGRDEGALWGGTLLDEASSYADRGTLEEEFFRASQALQTQEARREQRIRIMRTGSLVIIALLIFVTLGVYLWQDRQIIAEQNKLFKEQKKVVEEQKKVVEEQKKVVDTERESRKNVNHELAKMVVDRGLRSIETGDLAGSQLWFTKALAIDATNEFPQDVHRIRLGAGFRQVPRLAQILVQKNLTSAVFSPDGRQIITTGQDGRALLWDATGTSKPLAGPADVWMNWAAFSPNGRQLITGSGNPGDAKGEARIWNLKTLEPMFVLACGGAVNYVAFSPDGRHVLTAGEAQGGNQGEVRIWEAATGIEVLKIPHGKGLVNHAAFSPGNGRYVITAGGQAGSNKGESQLWDITAGRPLPLTEEFDGAVNHAEFSPDGRRVVLAAEVQGGEAGQARIVDLPTGPAGTPRRLLLSHPNGGVTYACFSPDGRQVVTASHDGTAQTWETASGRHVSTLKHGSSVFSATYSPDGRYVATASRDCSARVWEAATGQTITPPLNDTGTVSLAHFNPDGSQVLASSAHTARVWELATGNPTPSSLKTTGWVHKVECSADGLRVLTVSSLTRGKPSGGMDEARVWDTKSGQPLTDALRNNGPLTAAALSPDGLWVATASAGRDGNPGEVWIWDVETQKNKVALKGGVTAVFLAFSPDGKHLLTAGAERGGKKGTLQLWDRATAAARCALGEETDPVICAAFSPDNRWVATGTGKLTNDTGKAQVWSVETGKAVTPPLTHNKGDGGILHVAFSPNSQLLATASADDSARVWNVTKNGEQIGKPFAHTADVTYATFNPGSDLLVTVSKDQSAVVWDVASGNKRATFKHESYPNHAAFLAGTSLVATASNDGTARIWDLKTGGVVTILRHPGAMQHVGYIPGSDQLVTVSYRTREMDASPISRQPQIGPTAPQKGSQPPRPEASPEARDAKLRQVQTRVWNIAPDKRPDEDLRLLGEVLGARQLETATNRLVPVEAQAVTELVEHWRRLKKAYADDNPLDVKAAHLGSANECEATGQWFAAWWHLRQLGDDLSAEILRRRAKAALHVSKRLRPTDDEVTKYLEGARDDCKKAIHLQPEVLKELSEDMVQILDALGDAFKRSWEWEKAKVTYQEGVDLDLPGHAELKDKLAALDKKRGAFWDDLATAPKQEQRWDKVADVYRQAHKFDKVDPSYLVKLADANERSLRWDDAAEAYKKALDLEKDNGSLREKLAVAYERAGKNNEAVEAYENALKLDSKNWSLWQKRAGLYFRLGQFDKAIADYTKAIDLDRKVRYLLEERALAHEKLNQWPEAVADYTEAIKLPNPDKWLWTQRAQAFAVQRKWDKAADDLVMATKDKVSTDYYPWQRLALLRLAAGNHAEYRNACADMLKRFGEPSSPTLDNSKAWTCVLGPDALADPKEPVRLAERAVKGFRNNNHLNTLGAAYYRAGDYKTAIAHLEEGMKLAQTPGSSVAYVTEADWLFLAMANHKSGNVKEADKWLEKARHGIEAINQAGNSTAAPPPSTWQKLELEVLHREAEDLLKRANKTPP